MHVEIECPYCGHSHKNVYITDAYQEEIRTHQCKKCYKHFDYEISISITTESFKDEVQND